MTNEAASEKFRIPRNTISIGMNGKQKQNWEQTSSDTKKLGGCDEKQVDKAILRWFSLQNRQNMPIDCALIKEKTHFLEDLIF